MAARRSAPALTSLPKIGTSAEPYASSLNPSGALPCSIRYWAFGSRPWAWRYQKYIVIPITIQPMPTVRASTCSTTTETQAANVPIAPSTDPSGRLPPRKGTFQGPR